MSLDTIGLFRAMGEKMNWLGQRQKVIAQNVSNANTPGYMAQDITPFSFKEAVRGASLAQPQGSQGKSRLAATDVAHIKPNQGKTEARERDQRRVYEMTPDGNAVNMEEQMIKASQTAMDYQAVSNLYTKNFNLIMTAVGSNR